jgi:hypothetical protein
MPPPPNKQQKKEKEKKGKPRKSSDNIVKHDQLSIIKPVQASDRNKIKEINLLLKLYKVPH